MSTRGEPQPRAPKTGNAGRVSSLMRQIGAHVRGAGRIYLAGGSSAVLLGWRETAIDVDLKLEPESAEVFDAIAKARESLGINVDLAAPDDFIPPLPNWRERSSFAARHGSIDFLHYDFYAQALAKIERGHTQDLRDIAAMEQLLLVRRPELMQLFKAIEPGLQRFPAIDADRFRDHVLRGVQIPQQPWPASAVPPNLPGSELLVPGMAALGKGDLTAEALLVAVGAPRLRGIGLEIPQFADAIHDPELALYAAVCEAGGGHSEYKALIQRLVSFERAADSARRFAGL